MVGMHSCMYLGLFQESQSINEGRKIASHKSVCLAKRLPVTKRKMQQQCSVQVGQNEVKSLLFTPGALYPDKAEVTHTHQLSLGSCTCCVK